jgi:hypothetical protein
LLEGCEPLPGLTWATSRGLALPLFLFVSPTGFIVANSIAGALTDFLERAGADSALVGAIQYGGGIIGSALVGAFADGTPRPMGWVIALAGIGSLLCARLLVSARHRAPHDASDTGERNDDRPIHWGDVGTAGRLAPSLLSRRFARLRGEHVIFRHGSRLQGVDWHF